MNLQHLRYFVTVAEAGSITAAAEVLHISQPSLSRQIRAFEEELGGTLFERGAKSIQLNHRGNLVYEEGKRLMGVIDLSVRKILNAAGRVVIRIGYAPSLGGIILQQAVASFSQCHPQVQVEMHDSSSEEMRRAIQSGELDLCLGVALSGQGMAWQKLFELPLKLALPVSHPLLSEKGSRRVVAVSELHDSRFLFYSRAEYPEAWQMLSQYFQSQNVNVKVAGNLTGFLVYVSPSRQDSVPPS